MARLRGRLPRGAAERAGVRRGEKVVAWGDLAGGASHVIATDRALYVHGRRVAWHEVSKATWQEPVLTVILDAVGAPPIRIELGDARDLPPAIHDRVTDSVVASEHVDLDGEAGARMVARRDSDDGSIRWSVVFDSGIDPRDERMRAAADEALARMRSALGI